MSWLCQKAPNPGDQGCTHPGRLVCFIFGRLASGSPGCGLQWGAPAAGNWLAQGQSGHCRLLPASCQRLPLVMLRVACGIETCKGARLSDLNFSPLLQGDQKVALERAIFSSSEYPHMSSVQDTGQHFNGLKAV